MSILIICHFSRYVFKYVSFSPFFHQTVSVGRRKFSADFQLMFRLIKGLIFVTFIAILVTLVALPHMTMQDIIVCILAFMPTGWGLLLVSILISFGNYISVVVLYTFEVTRIKFSYFQTLTWFSLCQKPTI